jgi:PAS domain S-box-containing protein
MPDKPHDSADGPQKALPLNTFLTRLIWFCVLPPALLAVWLSYDHVKTLEEQRVRQAERLSQNTAAIIDSHLAAQIAALEILAGSVLIDNPQNWPRLYKRSMGYQDKFGGHVIFAAASGRMIFNTRAPLGTRLPDLPKVNGRAAAPEAVRTGKPAVGDMFIGPVAGSRLFAIAVPVIRGNRARYILISTVGVPHLKEHLDSISLPEGWTLSAVDSQGKLMAGNVPYPDESAKQFAASCKNAGWRVVLSIPRDIYAAPVYSAAAALMGAILIALLAGILGGRIAGGKLSRQVGALAYDPPETEAPSTIKEINSAHARLRNAAETLRESRETYHAFFQNSFDAIMLTSPDGSILEANPAACAMLGLTGTEICARSRRDLTDQDDPRVARLIEEREKNGMAMGELTMIRADGSPFPAEISSVVYTDRFGNRRSVMIIRDITERKRTEKELLEKEIRYRNLADSGPALIWTSGPDGSLNYFNEPWLRFRGRTLKQELGGGWTEGVHPDDLDRCMDIYMTAFDRKEPFDVEYRLLHAGGDYRWIRNLGTPAYDDSGEFSGYIGHCVDITDRKKAELDLRESEERFRSTLDNMLEGCSIIGFDWSYLYLNNTACIHNRRRLEEMEGRALAEIWPGIEKTDLFHYLKSCMGNRTPHNIENEFVFPDGSSGWFDLSIQPVPEGIFMLSVDITERKKAENELRRSEGLLKETQEMARLGSWSWDIKTGAVEWSDEVYKIFGLDRAGFTPHIDSILAFSPWPEDHQRDKELIRRAMESHEKGSYEQRFLRRDNSVGYYYSTFQGRYDANGELVTIVGSVMDITERRRLEEQLRHAQKIEGIGQLAGGIAHDFNNVLNAVIGYAGLIERRLEKKNPVRHFAEEITAAGMRGAALTQQILAFSRKQTLDMKPVDVNAIIRDLRGMLRRLVREDIKIELDLTDDNLVVMADTGQIDQVLINLTTNARDAITTGGAITISTRMFRMDDAFMRAEGFGSPGEYTLITFSDTGSGMREEDRLRIFDPFFTTKEQGKGTGLGLAVVHGIIKQHGGHISVSSEPGAGTAFNIYIPLFPEKPGEPEPEPADTEMGGNETILLAEDDPSLRKLTVTVLSGVGYKVIEAVDGEDAVARFRENSAVISLIILDGIMPKKNGMETFSEISRLKPGVRTIFVSGYTDGSIDRNTMAQTGAAYLQKPVKPDDLLRAVRRSLDSIR